MDNTEVTRRTAVAGLSVAAVAGVAACTRYGGPTAPPAESTPAPAATSTPAATGGEPAPAQGLTSTDDIPVGGGKVFKAEEVVITQPKAGEFKGFSAICKHQGCIVENVTGGTINCNCHGSKYRLDGAVSQGPAAAPLDPRTIKVEGDQISLS